MIKRKKGQKETVVARQLDFSLEDVDCQHGKTCAAPLCPRDVNFGRNIWFPHEDVCRLRDAPEWVRKQRQISKLADIDAEKYFTFRMLKAIEVVHPELQGANPDYVTAERIWFNGHLGRSRKRKIVLAVIDESVQPEQSEMEGFTDT